MQTTQTQIDANKVAIKVLRAVCDTIKEAGRVPAGTLYAGLMSMGCTMNQFQNIEGALIGSGLVRKEGQELVWAA